MKAKKHRFTLRTALATLLTLSLLVATAAFFGASASGDPAIVMTTAKSAGEKLTIGIEGNNIAIDWGDGISAEGVSGENTGTVKTDTIKIYGDNITAFSCNGSQLTLLDVSKCTNLRSLQCMNNLLSSLNVSGNTVLDDLWCDRNQLTALDVTNNLALATLNCRFNSLKSLDVSKNTVLQYFSCDNNQLNVLDVSKNTALKQLCCYNNPFSSIDLSKNTALLSLNCGSTSLTTLDVSQNTSLEALVCAPSLITTLDVSNNTALKKLACDQSEISTLDVSKNTALTELSCVENRLKYSSIKLGAAELERFSYFPQQDVSISEKIQAGGTIDLSSEYNIDDILTVYTWKDSEENTVTPTSSANGVFTFGNEFVGKTLTCEMTNEKFPDWTLKTTSVTVEGSNTTTDPTTAPTIQPATEPTTQPATSPTIAPTQANEPEDSDIAVEGESGFVDDAETLDKDGKPVQLQGVKLIVGNIETNKKKTVLDAIAHYNETFDADSDNVALYDISLVDNNKAHVTLTDGNKVRVCLKYPDNLGRQSERYTFHLYHQKADGTLEEISIDCKPNGIWFETDSFSPYALVWSEAAEITSDSPNTGEANTAASVACALALASVLCAGAVICRRKIAA